MYPLRFLIYDAQNQKYTAHSLLEEQLEPYHSLLCTCLLRVHNRIYNSKDSQLYRNGRARIPPN
ncbi:hypothetical protein T4A_6358 [Trichinella pseudospiralis]|uniref:Uncharacterized protein n=1 Tax=Trichinella pseudospiralis TaxID=6337 RepID=A0A0V1E3Y2_TRIPS|nr:hypothetical protein T4A_6358 [Trichinella pseudospiralis]